MPCALQLSDIWKEAYAACFQGSFFKLYNPEIATTDLLVNDASLDSKEVNFCAGNLSCIAMPCALQLSDIWKEAYAACFQGSFFKLYNPEIATTDLLVNDASLDSKEVNFCAGNLSCIAIDDFKSKHSCNKYCDMMSLKVFGENGI